MNGEGRIPPLLIAGLVFLVLAIGALAYYAGRFGRPADGPARDAAVELPPPGPPDPAVAQVLPTPAQVPPTATPAASVLIERETRTTRTVRSTAPLVERSSEIEVRVPAVIPTARPDVAPTPLPTPRRQIVVEVVSTPLPQPTPTPEEVPPEQVQEVEEEEEPPPEPEPTPRRRDRSRD
ncbi:MAG TPA: hypothetical protein VFF17_11960 [Thermoanaerobaculia bacterium]|nr:hypothetical protein [Thermoanaerobaculia bacterium]